MSAGVSQIPMLPDPTTPTAGDVVLPSYMTREKSGLGIVDEGLFENTNTKTEQSDSPDSGHKDMSSDSLSASLTASLSASMTHSDSSTPAWYPSLRGTLSPNNNNPPRSRSADNKDFDFPRSIREQNNNFVRPPSYNVHGEQFRLTMKNGKNSEAKNSDARNSDANNNPGLNGLAGKEAKSVQGKADLVTPKLNPPPKVSRRSPMRDPLSPDSIMTTSTSTTSSSSTSECSLADKRSSSDSSKSTIDSPLHSNPPKISLPTTVNERNTINNLSAGLNPLKKSIITPADASKLHLSFSDDDNTNSEDSGIPQPPQRLDSMTFDEFDPLNT